MKRLMWGVILLFSFFFLSFGYLYALTLSSVEGYWFNPYPTNANIHYYDNVPVSYGNQQENQIRWGYAGYYGQSGLGFTGVSPPPTSFEVDEPFEIGQLRHFNEPISPPAVSSVDLEIYLSFADPLLNTSFTFTFRVDETPNTTGDNWLDRDFIYFPNSYPQETFELDGTLYTLKLLGFGINPDNLVDKFESPEHSVNNAILWGKITTAPNPVPEPATIFLGSFGFLVVWGLRRFQNKST